MSITKCPECVMYVNDATSIRSGYCSLRMGLVSVDAPNCVAGKILSGIDKRLKAVEPPMADPDDLSKLGDYFDV